MLTGNSSGHGAQSPRGRFRGRPLHSRRAALAVPVAPRVFYRLTRCPLVTVNKPSMGRFCVSSSLPLDYVPLAFLSVPHCRAVYYSAGGCPVPSALKRRGDVAPSRRAGGGAPVPLPPVRLHSAAGPHLPAAPRPLPSVGPYGLRAGRLRATPALFFRLHAVLHGTVASVIRSLDAWWVWARVAVTSPTKRLLRMEHSGVRSVVAGDGGGGKCSVYAITTHSS